MFATWNLIGSFSVFTLTIQPMEKVFAGTFCLTSVERSCTDKKGVWANTFLSDTCQSEVSWSLFPFSMTWCYQICIQPQQQILFLNEKRLITSRWTYKYRLPANIPKCLFLIEIIWPENLLKIMPKIAKSPLAVDERRSKMFRELFDIIPVVGEVFAAIGRGRSFDQKALFEVSYRSFNCSMISYTSLHGGKLHIDNVQQWETVICSWSAITCCVWCFINKGRGRGEVTSTLGPLTLQNTFYWSSSTVKLQFPWLFVGSQRIAAAFRVLWLSQWSVSLFVSMMQS